MPNSHPHHQRWFGLWVLLTVIWGFSFVFIKVSGEFLDPYQVSFARLLLGAAVLVIYLALTRRKPITSGAALKHLAFCGLIAQAVPFALFAWAEQTISSVAAGLINSTMSLWTGLLAFLILPAEKVDRKKTIGLIIGFIGIMVLLGVWDAQFRGSWVAYLACTISTLGYAVSALWTRRYLSPMKLDPISAVATQLLFATASIGIASGFVSSTPTHWPIDGVLSIIALGALGTGIALVLNYMIIQRAGAITGSTVTYSMPIVSTFAGVWLLSEKVHWYEPVGAIIILLGIALIQNFLPMKRRDFQAEGS